MTPPVKKSGSDMYFANRDSRDIVGYLRQKIDDYYDFLRTFGHAERILKSLAYNAGGTLDPDQGVTWKIERGGEIGEVLLNAENHYRAIGQSSVNLTTAQRPAVQFIAKNSDKRSISRTAIANSLMDGYLTEAGLEALIKLSCENAVFGTEGFVFTDWDSKAGPLKGRVSPVLDEMGQQLLDETGQPQLQTEEVPSGDVRFRVFGMQDVIREPTLKRYSDRQWVILRDFVNKWDQCARYPDLAEEIKTVANNDRKLYDFALGVDTRDSDIVPLFEFYHERSPAVPQGRLVKFIGSTLLEDGPLPYEKIPLARETPSELLGTPFGTSALLDVLGNQETVNGIDTSITTNQLGRGVGNLLVPNAANITHSQFSTSMNAISYDGEQKPEPLAMPPTPAEFFEYKKDKISAMETITGVNSVVRGSPSEAVGADASGSKLALLQAQAVQQNNGLEKTHVQLIRDVAMNTIIIFRAFGGSEARLAKSVGKNNLYLIKEFYPQDLEDIADVSVDIGNPVTRQISGRMALADRLVELGLIKPENMRGYITLIREGTIDPLIEASRASLMRVQEENEKLLQGDPQWQHRALISDEHWIEIPKHLELLDNPDLRQAGQEDAQSRILAAVQEHLNLFRAMPPDLVLMRGGPNVFQIWMQIQQMSAPQLMQGQPQAAPQPQTPKQPSKQTSVQDDFAKDGMAAEPQLPNLPKNPATGQPNPAPSGMVDGQ